MYNIPLSAIAEALHKCGVIVEISKEKAIPFGEAYQNGCFVELNQNSQSLGLFFFYDEAEAAGIPAVPSEVKDAAGILNPNPPKRKLNVNINHSGEEVTIDATGEQAEVVEYVTGRISMYSDAGYVLDKESTIEGELDDGSYHGSVRLTLMPDPHAPKPVPTANEIAMKRSDEMIQAAMSELPPEEKKVIPKLSPPISRSDAPLEPKDRPGKPKDDIASDTSEKMVAKIAEFGIKKHSDPSKDPNVDPEILAAMKRATQKDD